jgi:hypothetical protein
VHTLAAVDFIMFNFGEFFYILAILYGELLLKKAAIYGVKNDELLSWKLTKN